MANEQKQDQAAQVAEINQHVASNIGIKAGRIDEEKAVEYGQRLRQLVTDMTGCDPHGFWKQEGSEQRLTE